MGEKCGFFLDLECALGCRVFLRGGTVTYTISEAAEKVGISVHTLRFYDKKGLLPFLQRVNGRRVFQEEDLDRLEMINCLKNTGMPLKDIATYMTLCQQGDATLMQRQEIIRRQKASIEAQLCKLQENLVRINQKMWYYETAVAAGTERIHFPESNAETDM